MVYPLPFQAISRADQAEFEQRGLYESLRELQSESARTATRWDSVLPARASATISATLRAISMSVCVAGSCRLAPVGLAKATTPSAVWAPVAP